MNKNSSIRNTVKTLVPSPVRDLSLGVWWEISKPTALEIEERPHMPPSAQEFFYDQVRNCSVYLEFGSGGSTFAAARHAQVVVTVESDKRFLDAVSEKVRNVSIGEFHPLHADLGWTRAWGYPTFKNPTKKRVARWTRYPERPWVMLEQRGLVPDIIVVDGRLRVACVLTCLLKLPASSDCLIIFDDVAAGSYYGDPIQPFVRDFQMHERTASFRKALTFDVDACQSLLEKFRRDLR